MGDMATYKGLTSDADKIAYLKMPGNGNLINQLDAADPSFKNWFDSADYATRSGQYDPATNTNYDTPGAPARSFATPTAAQLTNPAAQQAAPQSTAPGPQLSADPASSQQQAAQQSQLASAMAARRGNNWSQQPATRNYSAGQYAPQMPGGGQPPTFNTAQTGQAPTYYGQATAQQAPGQPSYYNAQQPQAYAQPQAYGNTGGGLGGKGGGNYSMLGSGFSGKGGGAPSSGGMQGGKGGGMATGNMGMGYGQQGMNYGA